MFKKVTKLSNRTDLFNRTVKLFLLTLLVAGIFNFPTQTDAAGANLFLSPSVGTHYVGNKITVRIYVSTSQSTNSYEVHLSTVNMEVTGLSTGGSICNLFPSSPSFTGTSAKFQCGLPTPGYTGSGGYIGAITVRGKAPGVGRVNISSSSKVLANDGAGTNILANRGSASFNIQNTPTAAPSINSPTHPSQDSWYKNKTATFNFEGSGSEFSYILDQNPGTTPDQASEGSSKSKTYENIGEGIWYFHLIVKGATGWSAPSHYRIQVDSIPPEPFTPEAEPKENAETRPIIAFSTTDASSGIDHYEIKLDDGPFEKINAPYKIPRITSGKHTIAIKAVDKAGNERIGTVEFSVKEIPAPKIELPVAGSLLPYGTDLIIQGQSFPNYNVKIFLDGKEIATVKADATGKFEFIYKELLRPGEHKLYAIATNPDNIESPKSSEVSFQLDTKTYVIFGRTVPANYIFSSLTGLSIIFLFLFILFLWKNRRIKKKLLEILRTLEEKVEKELEAEKVNKKVRTKVEKDFDEAEEKIE